MATKHPTKSPDMQDVSSLIRFSIDVLNGLRNDDGIYCFDREFGLAPTGDGRFATR